MKHAKVPAAIYSQRFIESSSESHFSDGRGGHCGAETTYSASLSNSSGATGTASYSASNNTLKIVVKGAPAGTTFDVQLDGISIGSLTTDDSGNGKLTLSNLTNAVNANSILTVGDLPGNFTQVNFSATLTGSSSTQTGQASYNSLKHWLGPCLQSLILRMPPFIRAPLPSDISFSQER